MALTTIVAEVSDPSGPAGARRKAEALARQMGFDDSRVSDVAIVVSELATNILKFAGHGEILVTPCRSKDLHGLEILALDRGRGIANTRAAMEDGQSTSGTLGHGLGAVRRLSDTFDLHSYPGRGTAALARLWTSRKPRVDESRLALGAVNVPKPGEEACGDAWGASIDGHQSAVIVADGLGHGILAAEASLAAIAAFERAPLKPPAVTLDNVHLALRPTRGAAVAIATIDLARDLAIFAGLGNIAGSIVVDGVRRNLVSHNGIAGHTARRLQEFTYPLPKGAILVMHSDGLASHWNPAEDLDLWTRDPALIAGVLYRDNSRRRDDSTVVVLRRMG